MRAVRRWDATDASAGDAPLWSEGPWPPRNTITTRSRRRRRAVPPPSAEPAQATAPDSGGLSPDAMEELKKLGDLHEQNVLTDEEFAHEKARILGSA